MGWYHTSHDCVDMACLVATRGHLAFRCHLSKSYFDFLFDYCV